MVKTRGQRSNQPEEEEEGMQLTCSVPKLLPFLLYYGCGLLVF
jgi:hypothetical protein